VQRHHPGLRAHPDERRERDRDLKPGAAHDCRRVAERARVRGEQDRDPGPGAGKVRGGDIEKVVAT
jgi:hypothetical protein